MKKLAVLLPLGVIGVFIAVEAWSVATGRGHWLVSGGLATTAAKQSVAEPRQTQATQPRPEETRPARAKLASEPRPGGQEEPIAAEALRAAETDPNIVAVISCYTITKDQLEKELLMKLQPYEYDVLADKKKPPDANAVLMKMLAEKAMIVELRKEGLLEKDEIVRNAAKKYRDRKLVELLVQKQLEDKLTATEAEIQARMKANAKLDRARAEQMVKKTKASALMDEYYSKLYKKANVRKVRANFIKAVQVYRRLLFHPKEERNVYFVRYSQIRNETTQEEKDLVLAVFKGGKVTLYDWLMTLNDIVPPRRPKNLSTTEGVDQLLDRALRIPILVAEAVSLGLAKDPELQKQVRDYEDRILLGRARQAKWQEVAEPNDEQIKAYFEAHKEQFIKDRNLRVDLIWCEDLATARQARAELDAGEDFNSVKHEYSLVPESRPYTTYARDEGYFWPDLWKGEPNQVVGPVKGIYRGQCKWRLVKILAKNPGTIPEFSKQLADRVKYIIRSRRRVELMNRYHRELLRKYRYKIYPERLKDISPLDIP